ncbi:MAG: hypothetical protein HXS44_01495 [Theionarchaea archaeon]|nr:hypothetical protein [Theionarchaea archaeon]
MNLLIISSKGVSAESTSPDMENINMLSKQDEYLRKIEKLVNKFKDNLEGYNDCLD